MGRCSQTYRGEILATVVSSSALGAEEKTDVQRGTLQAT